MKHNKVKTIEAVILAGGLGTRLKSTVPDLPKCMAPVSGVPFIDHLINHLRRQGVTRFILSLGYLSEIVIEHIESKFSTEDFRFIIESEPLGTGGAIRYALSASETDCPIVVNGDSLFSINIPKIIEFHLQHDALITCGVKPMSNFSRYGTVLINKQQQISKFQEKKQTLQGLINGGCYVINRTKWLSEYDYPHKFSFEKDVLEVLCEKGVVYGMIADEYFIDIGVPEDFKKAQVELSFEEE